MQQVIHHTLWRFWTTNANRKKLERPPQPCDCETIRTSLCVPITRGMSGLIRETRCSVSMLSPDHQLPCTCGGSNAGAGEHCVSNIQSSHCYTQRVVQVTTLTSNNYALHWLQQETYFSCSWILMLVSGYSIHECQVLKQMIVMSWGSFYCRFLHRGPKPGNTRSGSSVDKTRRFIEAITVAAPCGLFCYYEVFTDIRQSRGMSCNFNNIEGVSCQLLLLLLSILLMVMRS